MQNRDLGIFAEAGDSEDRLYLNITAPKNAKAGDKLLVMFWIHGGALFVGAGSDYNAEKMAASGNAVVVTINFRLGSLGIFAHPAIAEDSVNFGLRDQQFAMKWAQNNIDRFSGDPDNITIFGESSGGTSVYSNIVSSATV